MALGCRVVRKCRIVGKLLCLALLVGCAAAAKKLTVREEDDLLVLNKKNFNKVRKTVCAAPFTPPYP
jgi:hypothetical protein